MTCGDTDRLCEAGKASTVFLRLLRHAGLERSGNQAEEVCREARAVATVTMRRVAPHAPPPAHATRSSPTCEGGEDAALMKQFDAGDDRVRERGGK